MAARKQPTALDWAVPEAEPTAATTALAKMGTSERAGRRNKALVKWRGELARLPPKYRALPSPLFEYERLAFPGDMNGIRIVAGLPIVSTNNMYQNRGKFRVMVPAMRQYKARMILDLADQMGDLLLPGYLAVDFRLFMSKRHMGDIFNYEKLLTDVCMVAVGNDDVWVRSGHLERDYDPDNPRIEMLVLQTAAPSWDEGEERKARRAQKLAASAAAKAEKAASKRRTVSASEAQLISTGAVSCPAT